MLLSAVYLLEQDADNSEEIPLVLQQSEITDAMWINIEHILNAPKKTLSFPVKDVSHAVKKSRVVQVFIGSSTLLFAQEYIAVMTFICLEFS